MQDLDGVADSDRSLDTDGGRLTEGDLDPEVVVGERGLGIGPMREAERPVDVGGADDLRKQPVVAQRSVVSDGFVDDVQVLIRPR